MLLVSETALSSLINGWGRKTDTTRLVGHYWRLACRCNAFVYLERVESKSNISDGPTKDRLGPLLVLRAKKVPIDWGHLIEGVAAVWTRVWPLRDHVSDVACEFVGF